MKVRSSMEMACG